MSKNQTWKSLAEEWRKNPEGAIAYILGLLIQGDIKGSDKEFVSFWDGMILIQTSASLEKYDVNVNVK